MFAFIFALGITPKQVLHDIVTNHKHTKLVFDDSDESISKHYYICNVENQVATSPFIYTEFNISIAKPEPRQGSETSTLQFGYPDNNRFTLSRGPPFS